MKFKTTLFQSGKTATGIVVPEAIVDQLGAGKKPPVRITINGYTYRNTIAVMGGQFLVGVSAEHRKGANVAGGDTVDVTIELDTEVRTVEVPPAFEKALNKNALAKKNFAALSYSKKQALVLPVKDAKTEETMLRRIEKAMQTLGE